MICSLCGQRKARRACPALGYQICTVCCGTKRLTEIQCPSDCVYLTSAREHPPAVSVRRQQRDLALIMQFMRDFNQRQSQLFLLTSTFLVRYTPPDFQLLIDDDVIEAAAALAATFETAARGVIYEHRPDSLPAERLLAALKPALIEAGRGGGATFDRDAAVVLRRVEEAVKEVRAIDAGSRRVFLELLGRVIKKTSEGAELATNDRETSRLIVP
jgi:hypothetical protein